MDVAAQRKNLENKLRAWNKPAPTPTPFVPPKSVRGARGPDGNPRMKPAIDSGVSYPPLPDTTPPTSPPDPQNPPALPPREPYEDESEEDEEDNNWEEQEEPEEPVYDEGGREGYVAPEDSTNPALRASVQAMKQDKREAALERQRKEDAERFGGKLGATVMEQARATRQNHSDEVPPFPFEKMHEIALEKGMNADKVVGDAKRSYDLWNAYASNIKVRAEAGEDIPQAQLDEMKRLGAECCRIPAMLLGIPERALPQMIDEITNVADTSQEDLAKQANAHAEAMFHFSTNTVKVAQEAFGDDHAAVSAALTGAMALHFLGYNDRGYRRVRLAESFGQIMVAYQQQEAEEDAAKANAESPDVSELGGAKG